MDEYMCEECDTQMHPFAVAGGPSGYACMDCGWSFDIEPSRKNAFSRSAYREPEQNDTSLN